MYQSYKLEKKSSKFSVKVSRYTVDKIIIYLYLRSCFTRIFGCNPGQAPLEVGQHVLHGLGPLLLAVELHLHWVRIPRGFIHNFTLFHVVGKTKSRISSLNLLLNIIKKHDIKTLLRWKKMLFVFLYLCLSYVFL